MVFKTNSKTLLSALNICGKAVSTNGLIPAASCYRFTHDGVSACNMEISIEHALKLSKDKFDILIPADKIKAYIASLDEQELTFEWETLEMLVKITSNSGSCELQGEIGTDFPVIKTDNGNSFEMDIADLVEAFYRTSYSWMNDSTGNTLNGLNLVLSDKGIDFATFNGKSSFAKFNIDGKHDESTHILPKTFVNSITGAGNCVVNYSANSISIEHQGTIVKSVLLDGKFLDWKPLVVIPENHVTCDRLELISAIKRVLIFSEKVKTQIAIEVKDSSITITGEDTDLRNKAEETIKCSVGEPIRIGMNGIFVIEALNHMASDKIILSYLHHTKPMVIRESLESENIALIAPTVLKENM